MVVFVGTIFIVVGIECIERLISISWSRVLSVGRLNCACWLTSGVGNLGLVSLRWLGVVSLADWFRGVDWYVFVLFKVESNKVFGRSVLS